MLKVTAAVLVCFLSVSRTLAADGALLVAMEREAARVALEDASAKTLEQTGASTRPSKGHPVLIGTLIGAGAGAVIGAIGTTCDVEDDAFEDAVCGSHSREGGALLGAAVGAGVGALIGLLFRH
jgi:hypothetical protein